MNERYKALTATIETLEAERDRQKEAETENMTPEFREAMDLFFAVWRDGPLPSHLRPVARIIDELAAVWENMAGKPGAPVRCPDWLDPFWRKTVNGLFRDFKLAQDKAPDQIENLDEQEPEAPFIEPIAGLSAQGVTWQQVCRIYGPPLVDERTGQPNYGKFLKETKEPGSVLGPDHNEWGARSPEHKQQVAAIRRRRELAQRAIDGQDARRERQIADLRERQQTTGPDETPLEDLIAEGVSGQQIARMKKTTVAEIERQCREQGLPVPARQYSAAIEVSRDLPDDVREARERIGSSMFSAHQGRRRDEQPAVETEPTTSTAEAIDDETPAHDFGGDPGDPGATQDQAEDQADGD